MNKSGSLFLKLVVCGIIFLSFMHVVAAQNEMVTMDFYYSSNCGECVYSLEIIENNFIDNDSLPFNLTVIIKDIADNETNFQEYVTFDTAYPFVILRNETNQTLPITERYITVSNLKLEIAEFLKGNESKQDENLTQTPIGEINISGLSLPLLTIILGGLDSFNPWIIMLTNRF